MTRSRSVLRKNCTHCGNVFLTHEIEMEFCNGNCEHRHGYNEYFGFEGRKQVLEYCTSCGEEVRTPQGNRGKNRFCNQQCRKVYDMRQRIVDSNCKQKKPNLGNPNKISYENLDKISEKKRVFDDKHAYWYTIRGGSYGG